MNVVRELHIPEKKSVFWNGHVERMADEILPELIMQWVVSKICGTETL
jgi:hypothetical protein